MVDFPITISGRVICTEMEVRYAVQSFLLKRVCAGGCCSLGACLEEALGIEP